MKRGVEAVSVWQAGVCVIPRMRVAWGFWERGVGLMFRRDVPGRCGAGYVFPKCRDLHSFGMRFALDVVWVDDAGKVKGVRRGVPPGKVIRGPKAACHVFEVAAGRLPDLSDEVLVFREE